MFIFLSQVIFSRSLFSNILRLSAIYFFLLTGMMHVEANIWRSPVILPPSALISEPLLVFNLVHHKRASITWADANGIETSNQVLQAPANQAGWTEPPTQFLPNFVNHQFNGLQLAVDAQDNATAVWAEVTSSTITFFSSFRLGLNGIWSLPTQIYFNSSQFLVNVSLIFSPRLAIDEAGNAIIIWVEQINPLGTTYTLVIKTLTRLGVSNWNSEAEQVASFSHSSIEAVSQFHIIPDIAIDSAGNATAVWDTSESAGNFPFQTINQFIQTSTKTLTVKGVWPPAFTLYSFNQSQSNISTPSPQVAFDASDNAIVVSDTDSQGSIQVFRNPSPVNSNNWAQTEIPNSTGGIAPKLAINPLKDAIDPSNTTLTWTSSDFIDQVASNGGSTGTDWPTNIETVAFGEDPILGAGTNIAFDPSGNTIIVWRTQTNGVDIMHVAERFGPLPPHVNDLDTHFGPERGSNSVIITGTGLSTTRAVNFGSTPSPSFTILSDTEIVAVVPPGQGGVNVSVATTNGRTEDLINSQYIYMSTPLFPLHVQGHQKLNEFATQTDIVNILSWQSPVVDPNFIVMSYAIYRDAGLTDLVAKIPAEAQLRFEDHNRRKNRVYTYFIVAVDEFGQLSDAVSVVVPPRS